MSSWNNRPPSALIAAFLAAWALAVAPGLSGCDDESGHPLTEEELRDRLGIPEDAERVVVFGQNAHLDPGWQKTIPGYYDAFVQDIFLQAARLLDEEPRYHYSICEISFLDLHLQRHPEEAARLSRHAASGRLRIVGGGVTSPDTLLPSTEDLIRDYLLGSLWVKDELDVRPRTAWLPDSFGHSPTTPDLLAAMGYEQVGFARTDGLRTLFLVDFLHMDPIMEGSTAATLASLGSSSFVWKGPYGGEVLAHLMPVDLYCQGDYIDRDGGIALPGEWLGGMERTDREYTNASIAGFIEELKPWSRTPYMFVPVGCDFQMPKSGLVDYLDHWNDDRFSETGVWALAATFEDFMDLLGFHASDLPRLEADMNPYFTGFYATRPELKKLHRLATSALLVSEMFALLLDDSEGEAVQRAMRKTWWNVALANHHDFVTGTSTDDVYETEQLPMLETAVRNAEEIWEEVSHEIAGRVDTSASGGRMAAVVFNPASRDRDAVVVVEIELEPGQAREISVSDGGTLPSQLLAQERHGDGSLARAELAFPARGLPALGYRSFPIHLAAGQATGRASVAMLSEGVPTQDPALADEVVLENGLIRAVLRRQGGWVLASLVDLRSGLDLVGGPSAVLVPYQDDGGLWRLGMETPGRDQCAFTAGEELTAGGGDLFILQPGPVLAAVRIASPPGTEEYVREFKLAESSSWLEMTVEGAAGEGITITARFEAAADGIFTTAVPGGMVMRPFEKLYSPTFWPATEFVDLSDPGRGAGLALLTGQSTGFSCSADGKLEVMVLRNAEQEKCDFLGGKGTDPSRHSIRLGLYPHAGDVLAGKVLEAGLSFNAPPRAVLTGIHAGVLPASGSLVTVGDGAWVSALKRAEDGRGVILRLVPTADAAAKAEKVAINAGLLDFGSAAHIDALERTSDIPPPERMEEHIQVELRGALTTLRLLP